MAPACADALSLPGLDAGIAATLHPQRHVRDNARVALFLLEAGAIVQGDLDEPWRGEIALMERALNRWLQRHLSGLKLIAPRFVLCPAEPNPHTRGAHCDQAGFDAVRVFWHCARIAVVAVGERLDDLEGRCPGLGKAALQALRLSAKTFRIFTPDDALELASYLYWGWDDDESGYLAEIEDEQEREAARADMVTRAKIEAAMPAWVFERAVKPLSTGRLRALRQRTDEPFVAAVAGSILRLRRTKVPGFPFEIEGEFIDFAAVATWRESDITVQIVDDLLNMAHQAECCDISGELDFSLREPQAFADWLQQMTPFLKATLAADRLLWLLSEADYPGGEQP